MSKKFYIFLSMILAVLVLLSACANDKENNQANKDNQTDSNSNSNSNDETVVHKEGFPIVDEKIELTLMAPNVGQSDWDDLFILQEYEKMTNISFKFDTPPQSDFETKLNLAFASGELADILYAPAPDFTAAQEVQYGSEGLLLPLNDLIDEYAPHLKKILDENPDIKNSITTHDGNIYALPVVNEGAIWYRNPVWYNGDWLDALNVTEVPKTTDEFYELLKRFKEEDPNGNGEADEIPFTMVSSEGTRQWFLTAFGFTNWGIENIGDEVVYTPIEPNYKEYLTYMNKLYTEGLLDADVFTQSSDEVQAKGEENRIGVFSSYFSHFVTGQSEEEALNNPMFHPLTSPVSDTPLQPQHPGMVKGAFALTKDNPHPEASIRWVDYFYSNEGHSFITIGPEGTMWEWTDEAAEERDFLDVPAEFDTIEDWRGTLSPNWGILAPGLEKPQDGFPETDVDIFIDQENEEKILPYTKLPFPLVYLTEEQQQEISVITADLNTFIEQKEAQFITGVEPLENWDKYVQTIEDMNVGRLIDIYQEAYDQWAGN